ncbi:hypothetical protein BTJ40_09860 [Microbulbifer sp. A4B17]|uniref:cupin domain-containing protein n=1 Tax=Microbulbifer sp. A4B17 TaxID=359370 RepID=UPI000D52AC35|nr:cupin domain-containing protein [Microbulbifer sp. A4B17]AWF81094.1 hypothetical protein BTJ40_09860 [Microbulbifer sp. A4B17]
MQKEALISQKFYHLWCDKGSGSRTTVGYFSDFELIQYSNPVPEYHFRDLPKVNRTEFAILPPGWESDFHSTPSPQWVITLAGQWRTTTRDGVVVTYKPGDVHFGGDVPTKEMAVNQQGHCTINPSEKEPAKLLILGVDSLLSVPEG